MKIIKNGAIYGFECLKCESVFVAGIKEIQQSKSDSEILECVCPLCGNLVRERCSKSIELLCKMDNESLRRCYGAI